MVRLVVTDAAGANKEYPVSREMVIGRNRENDIRIKEEKASRTHCRIKTDNGRVTLIDLESSNGTRVNGQKIKTYVLKHGDTITIGKTTIVFHDEDQQLDRTMALPVIDEHHPLPDTRPPENSAQSRQNLAKPKAAKAAAVDEADEDDDGDDGEEAAGDTDGQEPVAPREKARSQRQAGGGVDHSLFFKIGVPIAALVLFIATVSFVVSYEREHRVASKAGLVGTETATTTDSGQTPVVPPPLPSTNTTTNTNNVAPPPIPTGVGPGPGLVPIPPLVPAANDAELNAQLTKVLGERDKALAASNFPGARAGIQSFAAAHPKGPVGDKARKEWKDTVATIDAALEPGMASARKAVDDKKYSLATQLCTRLLAADPSGKFGDQARELLANIDLETEPRYAELHGQAQEFLRAGKLREAADTLGRALDELGGAKWGAQISADQLQVVFADTLLEKMETERQKRASAGKDPVLKLTSKKLEGTLAKVRGVTLDMKIGGGGTLQVPIKSMDPADFNALLDGLGLSAGRLERAYLWLALGRNDAARGEVDKALQDPAQASAAAALAGTIFEDKNFHAWDFSKWQHQSDWDAQSGIWSTKNGKFVLESPEGGDTSLRPDAIGGKYPAAKARISFDFELTGPKNGYLFAFEFGPDEQHAISAIFNASGVTLSSNLAAQTAANDKDWKPSGATHVDVAVQGETFTVTVRGRPAQSLQVPGLGNLMGTITFRARETECAITHVILRHAD